MAFSTLTNSLEDMAYLAGIVDGEGCISITGKKGTRPLLRVSVTNTDKRLLDLLLLGYGGTMSPCGKERKTWTWCIQSNDAFQFLLDIRSYLRLKELRADVAIEFQASKNRHNGLGGYGRAWSEDEIIFQDGCRAIMRELNKGGEYGI